jgi:SAM-dependent methyltransferase
MNTYLIIAIMVFIAITAIWGYRQKITDEEEYNIEGFTVESVKEHYTDIYDKFYSNIYDQLFNSGLKNEFEIYNIKKYSMDEYSSKKKINVLDAGCGTGGHLKVLDKYGYKCIGLDKSRPMLKKTAKLNPGVQLVLGDFHNKSVFPKRKFTHITCLFYTIYYSDNPNKVFRNFNYWLEPKGYLCVHLVEPKNFDPILEKASKLIPLFNPQKHSHTRQTQTKLSFNQFKYVSDWNFNGNDVTFMENFLFKDDAKLRRNVHKFKMYSTKKYIKIGQKNGFKLIKIIDLTPVNHDNNSIYIFKKLYGS